MEHSRTATTLPAVIWLAVATVAFSGVAACNPTPATDARTAGAAMTPLQQAAIAFDGDFTERQIKERLDQALPLYGLSPSTDTYSRAASSLVALRKANGVTEMAILDYMIRSHVPGVKLSFPEAAAISAVFLKSGDK